MLPFAIHHPEKYIADRYLVEMACNRLIAEGVRDLYSELENGNGITTHENRDDGIGELKCLGSGKPTIIEQGSQLWSQVLPTSAADLTILTFARASIGNGEVHSIGYTAMESRHSCSVCVKDPSRVPTMCTACAESQRRVCHVFS